jgi:bile acid-coenzyme A ligase
LTTSTTTTTTAGGAADEPGRTPLGRTFDRLAAEDPDRPAVTCGDARITRAELRDRTDRLAQAWARLGVTPGSLVTIGLPNGIGFIEATVTAWKLGATPQPVSSRLPAAELRALIEVADPALVVGLDPGDGRPWVIADDLSGGVDIGEVTPLAAVVSPAWKALPSGGSTGRPKLIVTTVPAVEELITPAAPHIHIHPEDTFLCSGPLYHNGPFLFGMTALILGGHIVVMERFDAMGSLELVERHGVTYFYAVPTMLSRILHLPEADRLRPDLRSLRVVFHLGAPCPPHVKRAWIDWLGPERVVELYGGTEAQASTVITGTEWLAHPGSVGRPMTGRIRIGDSEAVELPVGEIGEVWLQPSAGPTYRYLGAEARTRDGWESLGDMGWMDADGYLYLGDRRSDMILVGGSNVFPAEVEAALDEHPAVLSSCVIGLPDDDYGNVIHAIVQAGPEVTDDDLLAHLRTRLVAYKLPRRFERTTEPLRDDAGKVRRPALREARLKPAP